MLASIAHRIARLEDRIKQAYEKADDAGKETLPRSVYTWQEKIAALREQAANLPVTNNKEAVVALKLATNGRDGAEARLIRQAMAYLSGPLVPITFACAALDPWTVIGLRLSQAFLPA